MLNTCSPPSTITSRSSMVRPGPGWKRVTPEQSAHLASRAFGPARQ
jgi:hypothetical protein